MATNPEKYQVVRGELDAITFSGDLNGMQHLLKKGCNPNDAGIACMSAIAASLSIL
jgi:hypothetical protein